MTWDEIGLWLDERTRVLDGATGSELLRRGVAAAGRLWGVGALVEDAGAVRVLHRDYAAAGAEALTAATFRVAPYALRGVGLEGRAGELARAGGAPRPRGRRRGRPRRVGVRLADDAGGLLPPRPRSRRRHARARARGDGGHPGAGAARRAPAGDVQHGARGPHRRRGRRRDRAAGDRELRLPPRHVALGRGARRRGRRGLRPRRRGGRRQLHRASRTCCRPWCGSPPRPRSPSSPTPTTPGTPADSPWLAAEPVPPEGFARAAATWAAAGARLVGGCCGTGPEHIAAIAARLAARGARMPVCASFPSRTRAICRRCSRPPWPRTSRT